MVVGISGNGTGGESIYGGMFKGIVIKAQKYHSKVVDCKSY